MILRKDLYLYEEILSTIDAGFILSRGKIPRSISFLAIERDDIFLITSEFSTIVKEYISDFEILFVLFLYVLKEQYTYIMIY